MNVNPKREERGATDAAEKRKHLSSTLSSSTASRLDMATNVWSTQKNHHGIEHRVAVYVQSVSAKPLCGRDKSLLCGRCVERRGSMFCCANLAVQCVALAQLEDNQGSLQVRPLLFAASQNQDHLPPQT